MIINFPVPPPGQLGQFLQECFSVMRRALLPVITKDEATPRVLLLSQNGTVYSITTSDAGVITTTLVTGKTREI